MQIRNIFSIGGADMKQKSSIQNLLCCSQQVRLGMIDLCEEVKIKLHNDIMMHQHLDK